MMIPEGGLSRDWIVAQLKDGAITTEDLLTAWNTCLEHELTWSQARAFKNKCNRLLMQLERMDRVERVGKAMQAHAYHTCWMVRQ